jgi:L-ornithine N5-monooxygenase
VEPCRAGGQGPGGWLARLADGSAIRSRYLVFGTERDGYIPPVLRRIGRRHLIHSSEYRQRITEIPSGLPYHVVVIGEGHSAAAMFDAVRCDLPHCRRTLVMRSIDVKTPETRRCTHELDFPGFMDTFFSAQPSAREQVLRDMPPDSYPAPAAPLPGRIHRDLYLDRLAGRGAMRIVATADVTAAREEKGEVVLVITDRTTGRAEELRCDLVLLGTGYAREMPAVIRGLAGALGLDRIEVTRDHRLKTNGGAAPCYLHGVDDHGADDATHGIAGSPPGGLAVRAAGITRDILSYEGTVTDDAGNFRGRGSRTDAGPDRRDGSRLDCPRAAPRTGRSGR